MLIVFRTFCGIYIYNEKIETTLRRRNICFLLYIRKALIQDMIFVFQNMGIKDEFHQKNILVCIEELYQPSSPLSTAMRMTGSSFTMTSIPVDLNCPLSVNYQSNNAANNTHNLVLQSFSVLKKCDKCNKYLRGLLHQGFLCKGMFSLLLNYSSLSILQYIEFYM